jgi:hypothetical protein
MFCPDGHLVLHLEVPEQLLAPDLRTWLATVREQNAMMPEGAGNVSVRRGPRYRD